MYINLLYVKCVLQVNIFFARFPVIGLRWITIPSIALIQVYTWIIRLYVYLQFYSCQIEIKFLFWNSYYFLLRIIRITLPSFQFEEK